MAKAEYIGDLAKRIREKKNLTQARAASEAEVSLYNWRVMEQGYVSKSKRSDFVPKVQLWVKRNYHFIKGVPKGE